VMTKRPQESSTMTTMMMTTTMTTTMMWTDLRNHSCLRWRNKN
jgi:hypothetical protein